MRGNFVEISFEAKFLRKARNFVEIRLHYFCTILYVPLGMKRIKVARLDFLGEMPPKFERQLCRHEQRYGKKLPQLYYIKIKLSYDLGFLAIGVAIHL